MLRFTVLWTVLTSREYSPEEMAAFDDSPRQTVPHASAQPIVRQGVIWAATGAVIVVGVALLGLDKQLYSLGFRLIAFGLAQIVNRWTLAARADRLLNNSQSI